MGMAGNGDEGRDGTAGRAAAVHAAWVETRLAELRSMVDEQFAFVRAVKVDQDDLAAADRKTRAITSLARSVAAVEAAARRMMSASESDNPEDEMDDSDRPDAETAERYRAEMVRRMDRLRAIVETKRLAGDAENASTVEGGDEGDPGSGVASGGAVGAVADLGDAGWSGVRQDLCGSPLAA